MKRRMLTETYGGYHRVIPENDVSLTAVEHGSAMGGVLSQVWQPVALASENDELSKAFRMFGEDLVVFRTKKGEIGTARIVVRRSSLASRRTTASSVVITVGITP